MTPLVFFFAAHRSKRAAIQPAAACTRNGPWPGLRTGSPHEKRAKVNGICVQKIDLDTRPGEKNSDKNSDHFHPTKKKSHGGNMNSRESKPLKQIERNRKMARRKRKQAQEFFSPQLEPNRTLRWRRPQPLPRSPAQSHQALTESVILSIYLLGVFGFECTAECRKKCKM